MMGLKFLTSIEIATTPEAIWYYANDLDEWARHVPNIKRIVKLTEGPLGKGSKVRVVASNRILTAGINLTITEYEEFRYAAMDGRVLGTYMTRFYQVEPLGDKIRFTLGGEVSGFLAWMVRRSGQRLSEAIAQAAKKKFEGDAHAAGGQPDSPKKDSNCHCCGCGEHQ
jgi:hypothetical protein